MILSYESLLQEWIKIGDAKKIINIKKHKNSHMDYFLSRDSNILLNLVKEGDNRTLVALLRCFDQETIDMLRSEIIADAYRTMLYEINEPESLAISFLAIELQKNLRKDMFII